MALKLKEEVVAFEELVGVLYDKIGQSWQSKDETLCNELLGRIERKQKELTAAAVEVDEQLLLKKEIEVLEKQYHAKEEKVREYLGQLRKAESDLHGIVHICKKKLEHIRRSEKDEANVDDIVRYAHYISTEHSVSAPPGWMPGSDKYPYPTEHILSRGILSYAAVEVEAKKPKLQRNNQDAQEQNGADIFAEEEDNAFTDMNSAYNSSFKDNQSLAHSKVSKESSDDVKKTAYEGLQIPDYLLNSDEDSDSDMDQDTSINQ